MANETSQTSKETSENNKPKDESPLLVLWDALPAWQQDNQYILGSYRPASNSYWISAASLGYLHNESVNIYSHLIGAAMFLSGGVKVYLSLQARYKQASTEDAYVFACFFLGAVACLGMSATYHTISNHSQHVASFGNKLDYIGIVALIWGSFIPSIYYGFACEPSLVKFYWTMISTIGAGCAMVSTISKFRTPKWRPFRASMFAAMGLSAVIPVLHGLRLYGMDRMENLMGLRWVILQGFLYLLGAALYGARVPERFSPGYFDVWGSSHQIFHLLVVAAAVSHLVGLIKAFDYHHSTPTFLLYRRWSRITKQDALDYYYRKDSCKDQTLFFRPSVFPWGPTIPPHAGESYGRGRR